VLEKLVTLRYAYINHQREENIEKELEKYLDSIDRKDIFSNLNYITKEFVANANKANLKRVFFNSNNLDINQEVDYKKGIQNFRDEININYENYVTLLEKNGYFVRLDFYVSKGFLIISAINNTQILPIEKERFLKKLNITDKFKSFEDVLNTGLDMEESAGYGIIISVMMLKKIGLNEKFIKLIEDAKYTQMKLIIPLSLIKKMDEEYVADEIVKEIDEIPQIPQHIVDLQIALNNENANFTVISKIIKNDPTLIAGILKTANSAFYMLPKKVNSIEEAVRLIGLKGVRNLILTYSIRNILVDKFHISIFKKIISHSNEVAFYAYNLSKKLGLKNIVDDIYLAGILHDIGKIIINSLKPEMLDKIKKICREKNISEYLIENLTDGYNHSLIGAKLAKKWNFPEHLVNAISTHHNPLDVNKNYIDMGYITYLADRIYYYIRNEINFDSIKSEVLERYNLLKKENFDNLITLLNKEIDDKKITFEDQ